VIGGLLALLLAQATPVFRSGVEAVNVDVFVSKKSAPVVGLQAEDFEVKDNGVPQQVVVVNRELTPTTAVLALDVSASVAGRKLEQLRAAARAFLAHMRRRDEAALLTFNHRIELRRAPTTDREALARALDDVTASGGTAVIDALYLGLKKHWGRGRPLVVLFTDGEDTGSWMENDDVLQAARESSALLYVVGTKEPGVRPPARLGTPEGRTRHEPGHVYLLRRAAETTGGAFWTADPGRLQRVFLDVLEAANARYILSYEPQGVKREGHHRLGVSVHRRGVEVRARQEYVVPGAASLR
jgi:Ca-activated chloride channel family protein